jgi:iron complex transport system ATP-binding protein
VNVDVVSLRVSYGRHVALADVSLDARPGEVLAVVGPNGSGKSSLLKAIAGVAASSGRIAFAGGPRPSWGLGYMPQDTASKAALTVLETVLLGRLSHLGLRVSPHDLSATTDVLHQLGIDALSDRLLGELSGGQRQMVFLAQALAGNPRVLLLDEPISALDIRHQLEVLAVVRRQTRSLGLTTLVILHDLVAAARHADRIALMAAGRLVAIGPPAEVLTVDRIAEAFGVRTTLLTDPLGHLVIVPLEAMDPRLPA